MKNIQGLLMVGCSALALAGCGPSDIASPGTGGNVTINNNTGGGSSGGGSSGGSGTVTPASGCPTIADPQGLVDAGTIQGPTGTWRVCTLPSRINKSITLQKVPGLLYQLGGRVDVGTDGGFTKTASDTNVTLTIDPGVILFGGTGTSWLAVNRGNKIHAVGTQTQPIIFTSRDNVLGLNNETSQGQWGGVVLMGRAKITDCDTGTPGNLCERKTEGAVDPAIFGGNDDADNSGEMSYVQIRYSGYVLSADKELQSLTGEGIGSGTTLDHIMSYNSSDDGSEWFGGVPRMKYYIAVGADDDSLDVDTGARGNFQYGLLIQRAGAGDALMEIDSNGKEDHVPRTDLRISNFTMLQSAVSSNNEANDKASILLRGNSDTKLTNSIIITPNNECIRMNGSGSLANRATLSANSVVMHCNATKYIGSGDTPYDYSATDVGTIFNGGTNNSDSFVETLNFFTNGSNENGRAVYDVSSLNAGLLTPFFTTVTYIGAVKDSADTWYTGWTCNSSAANFGTGNSGSCASLPTT